MIVVALIGQRREGDFDLVPSAVRGRGKLMDSWAFGLWLESFLLLAESSC